MKIDIHTGGISGSLESLERAINSIRDGRASDINELIADAFDAVRESIEEVVNALDDAEFVAED